jgi:GTP cyclohydrolase I
MPDVQGSEDRRQVPINKVGVKDIRYPIALMKPESDERQHTVAMVNMYVALPHYQKGTHMSRFLEVLNKHHQGINSSDVMEVARDMKVRLEAEEAHLQMTFPYFIDKKAPVTGQAGKLDIEVTFEAVSNGTEDFILGIKVPATSLCPCSKEISEYGAHNQRSHITMNVKVDGGMWLEDLIEIAEQEASCELWGVLKREDEKYVTERAYENPKFVEDLVRDVAARLTADPRVRAYSVESENFESIHNHSAYARIDVDKDA